MKFIVNSQNFSRALQTVSGALSNNNTVPITNCFHFHLDENKLTVKATDLMTTLVTSIPVDTGELSDFREVAVPSGLMMNILKSLDDMPLTFDVNEQNYGIEIISGEGHYRLAGRSVETYPQLSEIADPKSFVIPASVLVSAISKTIFAAGGDDEAHQQLSGIFCESTPESTTFVATDGHKLVRYRRTDIKADDNTSFILPRKPISMIKGLLLSNKEDVDVIVQYNNANVSFTFGNIYAVCSLLDGKYPNYEAAIPRDTPSRLIIDRSSFLNTLRRVGLFANQSTHQVRLSITSGMLTVSSEDLEFANDARENVACEYDGENVEIGFCSKFLVEMVSALDTEQVMLEIFSSVKPGIITPVVDGNVSQSEDVLMLVMPMSLVN